MVDSSCLGATIGSAAEERTLLWEESYPPGEYGYAFVSPVPTSADEVREFLSAVVGADTSASTAIQAITILLDGTGAGPDPGSSPPGLPGDLDRHRDGQADH